MRAYPSLFKAFHFPGNFPHTKLQPVKNDLELNLKLLTQYRFVYRPNVVDRRKRSTLPSTATTKRNVTHLKLQIRVTGIHTLARDRFLRVPEVACAHINLSLFYLIIAPVSTSRESTGFCRQLQLERRSNVTRYILCSLLWRVHEHQFWSLSQRTWPCLSTHFASHNVQDK